jgi:hypothetical protein
VYERVTDKPEERAPTVAVRRSPVAVFGTAQRQPMPVAAATRDDRMRSARPAIVARQTADPCATRLSAVPDRCRNSPAVSWNGSPAYGAAATP